MTDTPAMMLWTDAYMADTSHLTTTEHGAYLLILMAMWRAGGHLPNDEIRLARVAKLPLNVWRKIAGTILEFMTVEGHFITQKRLRSELEIAVDRLVKARASGRIGGVSKSLKNNKPVSSDAKETLVAESKRASTYQNHSSKKESSSLRSEPNKEKSSPDPERAKSARGTRMTADWQPSEGVIAQARSELEFDRSMVVGTDLLEFRDHWISVPGAKGLKLDWDRTYMNRLRQLKERRTGRYARAGPASQRRNPIFATVEKNIQRRQQHEPNGHVSEANGSVSDPDIHSPLGDDIQAPGSAPTGRPRGILSRSFFGRDS